jgi:V/A-type H+-transporting ATPase subunit A
MLTLVLDICDAEFDFDTFEDCNIYYKEIINIMRQMNYSEFKSEQFNKYLEQLNKKLSNDK